MSTQTTTKSVRVWDLPLRLFHWLLLAAVVTAFVAIQTNNIELHAKAGYAVLALLIFRIVWGFVGGTHARFCNFIKGPAAIKAYLANAKAGKHDPSQTGHNALGALSVVGLIGVLLLQVTTGLFNHSDDFFFDAPLYKFVNSAMAGNLAEVHETLPGLILALIGLHIAAILFYRFVKRDNLVKPMITGSKDIPAEAATADAKGGNPLLGAVVLAIAMAIVWYITTQV